MVLKYMLHNVDYEMSQFVWLMRSQCIDTAQSQFFRFHRKSSANLKELW